MEVIKKEKEKEKIEKGIQSEAFMCVKLRVIDTEDMKKAEKMDIKIFDFDSKHEFSKDQDESEEKIRYLEKPEVYLNICKSQHVLAPLTSDMNLADSTSNSSWKIIPVSFELESKQSGDLVIYDAHVNENVVTVAQKDRQVMNSILYYILRKFQFRLGQSLKIDVMNADVQRARYMARNDSKVKPSKHVLNPECDPG